MKRVTILATKQEVDRLIEILRPIAAKQDPVVEGEYRGRARPLHALDAQDWIDKLEAATEQLVFPDPASVFVG